MTKIERQQLKSLSGLCTTWIFLMMSILSSVSGSLEDASDGVDLTKAISQADMEILNSNLTSRIVGGTWTTRGAYPFQAIIDVNQRFGCAGTLLESRRHVLTAAHCIDTPQTQDVRYKVYFRTLIFEPLDENHIERQVVKLIQHEEFNLRTLENDIGIITLNETVDDVLPVQLETYSASNQTYAGQLGTIVGWGYTRQVLDPEESIVPAGVNHLKHANITILENDDCNILYLGEFNVTSHHICGSTLYGKGVCQGDSGGPLLIDGVQVGVVSASAGCADPRYPSLFLRIARYREWIERQTNDEQ